MPCRDRCLLRLGPAEQRVRSPPAPRSGQIEPIPSLAAATPTKAPFDQPRQFRCQEERRDASPPSPPRRRRSSLPARFEAGPAAVVTTITAPAPLDADGTEPSGLVADVAVAGTLAEDPLPAGATPAPADAHTAGEMPTPDGSPVVRSQGHKPTMTPAAGDDPRRGGGVVIGNEVAEWWSNGRRRCRAIGRRSQREHGRVDGVVIGNGAAKWLSGTGDVVGGDGVDVR
ncbi:hypothetical protein ZWY2020_001922 [Hordeum vulgare]|nr:hypothetical protein ZWY2020_001922 [Hordeum vulgare]